MSNNIEETDSKNKTPKKERVRTLELLAPARNLECGIAAIDHGADAVYIGAPRFGARSAAGNSLDDIRKLCEYAHQYGAKVHVTVNTIIYEEELEDTLQMVVELDKIGVDALLLQDMGVLAEIRAGNLWSRELHSSTQCDARTADKVLWLSTVGFTRVVLARELSLQEISAIHKEVGGIELEVFVHGALCVSYSGVCYASEKCFGRSANRGECAQFCRMKFDLVDSEGREIEHQRHLLSLKDLCQIDHMQELADAGASSFKIEGRLKDVNYVKNVVAAYSEKLDEIVAKYPHKYCRASMGRAEHRFTPDLKKTFNRGYTNYFLNGRQPDVVSFDTPKAIGEYVGKVKELRGNISFNVATTASFMNGDGLCFINDNHELEGFRVNRVAGNRLYPFRMPEHLRPGMALYRNHDRRFETLLSSRTSVRKIPLLIALSPFLNEDLGDLGEGVIVRVSMRSTYELSGGLGYRAVGNLVEVLPIEPARRPQTDNLISQMKKMGDTVFEVDDVVLYNGMENFFIPNSTLSNLRRVIIENVEDKIKELFLNMAEYRGGMRNFFGGGYTFSEVGEHKLAPEEFVWQPEYAKWPYLYNVANESARRFYERHGLDNEEPAFEVSPAKGEALLMQCRHCLRYSLGYCVKRGGRKPAWKEPLYLRLGDGRRFRLDFVCNECQMNIIG